MNLFDLFAKITLDTSDYENGIKEAKNSASEFAEKLGSGLKTAAGVATAAVGAAATGIVALTKSAISNYAEYEQLVGGVETLFKESADTVQEYAENAYKTAGLSANEYMNTVTSFSASLLQSLGGDTDAAAKKANLAITDMSDNANKMGTSMESIQNAYQGFAKQNYTMLDNLKIGYGGTKEEMDRLLADAERLSGIEYDISSYADIVEAIHVIQTEMGITGTTAKEASTTIQGSISSMKSAWSNLVTGIADDNADFDILMENFTASTETVLDNIIPRIEIALNGAGELIDRLVPVIVNKIPELITQNLPKLVESGVKIIKSLVNGIKESKDAIVSAAVSAVKILANGVLGMLPDIISLGLDLVISLAEGIAEALPELVPTIIDVILKIVDVLTDPDTLSNLIDAAIAIIFALAEGLIAALPDLIDRIPLIIDNIITAVSENAPKLVAAGIQLIVQVAFGMIQAIPQLIGAIPKIISSLISGFGTYFKSTANVGKDLLASIKNGFMEKISGAKDWGKDLIQNFIDGIKSKFESLKNTVTDIAGAIKDLIGFSEPKKGPLSNFHTYAPDMMDLFAKGIRDNEKTVTDQIEQSFNFGRRTIDVGFATGEYSANQATSARAMSGIGTINITVNGANYNSEKSLAEAIAEELQNMVEREGAIYA